MPRDGWCLSWGTVVKIGGEMKNKRRTKKPRSEMAVKVKKKKKDLCGYGNGGQLSASAGSGIPLSFPETWVTAGMEK